MPLGLTTLPGRSFALTQSMLEHADKANLGYVSMDDFYRLMKKKSNNTIDDLLGDD
jgi:Ca2+-binding EF-hand superfamily protein